MSSDLEISKTFLRLVHFRVSRSRHCIRNYIRIA